ncbi:ATP-binding protein [Myroides sp. M-43]|uniref:AAA family ATPase n=1 Tax=Myroides oncorhynchi TaxID=2893756 RepID=UPI001E54A0DE|nr:AAA family ATPase [Myroides oncorhynchi]MCC9043592.1 ATP-binding protein [Myroides oncorhynchi]
MNYLLDQLIKDSELHKDIFLKLEFTEKDLSVFDRIKKSAFAIKEQVLRPDINDSYIELYSKEIETLISFLPFRGGEDSSFVDYQDPHWKQSNKEYFNHSIKQQLDSILLELEFQVDLFNKIGQLESNLVIVGANGSGKTSLAEKLKINLNYNGTVVSAQRILRIPEFQSVSNKQITLDNLISNQRADKRYKNEHNFSNILNEFEIVIQHLLAENISLSTAFRSHYTEEYNKDKNLLIEPVTTKLDETIEIWNSLISHRILKCEDGMNFKTFVVGNENSYLSIQMSEGEKNLLYLIIQVLLAPKNGFIVIDEPEMYLHKTILKKLWDKLEIRREDCLFIYLTHDLDFATSRKIAKKIWLKSYNHPNAWELEVINSEEIPEALLLEILGSSDNILFCEGKKNSIDEKLYSMLFSNYTIIPVGSCFDVMNHTKAFNKLQNVTTKAIGIIDSDHHSRERLDKLKENSIYSFSVSEIENLFLDEEFLRCISNFVGIEESAVVSIKESILDDLKSNIDLQVSNYVSTKINNIFNDCDLSKGNSLDKINENYESFKNTINIEAFYEERKRDLEEICNNNDYEKAILIYNNKGLKKHVEKHFKITEFTLRCFLFLQKEPEKIDLFRKYFPIELF